MIKQGGFPWKTTITGFKVPAATYRLQFHHGFRFITAQALVPYLHDLGISDSMPPPSSGPPAQPPWLFGNQSSGDKSGVGVPGLSEGFEKSLEIQGKGLLLDIVPNHMALSHDNPWWMEVLENGPGSPFAIFFDIDWHPSNRMLDGCANPNPF